MYVLEKYTFSAHNANEQVAILKKHETVEKSAFFQNSSTTQWRKFDGQEPLRSVAVSRSKDPRGKRSGRWLKLTSDLKPFQV